ncbi:sigma-70 family RNA polymerase sigma factor [Nakamurella silvestris]|nr:sigma-70 family RNA polymerase sigma factor [Nakamurella silvestris]
MQGDDTPDNAGGPTDAAPSDAELISRVRDGDRAAFGSLYERHAQAAASLARQFARSTAEADDLVSEAFARVLDTLLDGRGPDSSFRAYLFTTLRHTSYDRTRKDRRLEFTDDLSPYESADDEGDPVLAQMESGFIAKAFAQLPERWRTVLWHTQVEGQSAAEVGVLLGMAPNAVSSLAFRAREGLREAYLQVHMTESVAEKCRTTINRLGAWTRGGLSKREQAQVDAHLAECDRCPALAAELAEVNSGLRVLLAPLLLGSAAAGYLATLPAVPALVQVGAEVTAVSQAGTASGGWHLFRRPEGGTHTNAVIAKVAAQPVLIGSGIAAAVAAVVLAFTLGSPGTPSLDAAVPPAPGITGTPNVQSTAPDTAPSNTGPADTASPVSDTGSSVVVPSDTAAVPTSPVVPDPVDPADPAAPGPTFVPPTSPASVPTGARPTPPGPVISTPAPVIPFVPPTTAPTLPVPTTPVPSTAAPSTPPSTSPPSTPPTTTTPPTTAPPTTTPQTPASVNPGVPVMPGDLVAGGVAVLELPLTNSGGTDSAGTPLRLDLPTGVEVGDARLDAAGSGLRPANIGISERTNTRGFCTGTGTVTCVVPSIPAGSSRILRIGLTVDPAAAGGSIGMTWAGRSLGQKTVSVGPGYSQVALRTADGSTATAGSTPDLTVVGTPVAGSTNPGAVTLPLALSEDVIVTGAGTGCTLTGAAAVCVPDVTGHLNGVLHTVIRPSASGAQTEAATAALPGGRELKLVLTDAGLTVIPRAVTAPLDLTGPFGGAAVGQATLYCTDPTVIRADCEPPHTAEMTGATAQSHKIAPPAGSTVLSAVLTWAATEFDAAGDTVQIGVNGGRPVTVGPGASIDVGTGLQIRTADITALELENDVPVAQVLSRGGAVQVTGLAAKPRTTVQTPLGGWVLTVVWIDGTKLAAQQSSQVQVRAAGASSLSTVNPQLELLPAGNPYSYLAFSAFATDPWAHKTLTAGGNQVAGFNGVDGENRQNGFDLFTGGLTGNGPLVFGNVPGTVAPWASNADQVWIGPILAVRGGK